MPFDAYQISSQNNLNIFIIFIDCDTLLEGTAHNYGGCRR